MRNLVYGVKIIGSISSWVVSSSSYCSSSSSSIRGHFGGGGFPWRRRSGGLNAEETGHREEALSYLKMSSTMVRRLFEILIENLGVDIDDSRIESLIGMKRVKMNFYPICPNPELTLGAVRHSDMCILTVLLQDDVGGLYVKLEEDTLDGKKGEWIEIPPAKGALVVNVGDSLQILSNGRYRSVEHKVRTTSKQSRVSIPVFSTPKPTEKIGPPPHLAELDGRALYREVTFGEYMRNFFGHALEGKKALDFVKINTS